MCFTFYRPGQLQTQQLTLKSLQQYCCKYLLLFFKLSNKTKYSKYTYLTLCQVNTLLPPHIAHDVIHNRFTNNRGERNTNVEMDREVEHSNQNFKQDCKHFHRKITEMNVNRSCTSFQATHFSINSTHIPT